TARLSPELGAATSVVHTGPELLGSGGAATFGIFVPDSAPAGSDVTLHVIGPGGEEVDRRDLPVPGPGWMELVWDPPDGLSPGVYRYRIVSESSALLGSGSLHLESTGATPQAVLFSTTQSEAAGTLPPAQNLDAFVP